MEVHSPRTKRVYFQDHGGPICNNAVANSPASSTTVQIKLAKFHSQPIPASLAFHEAVASGLFPNHPEIRPKNQRIDRLKDNRFNSFKTWSGKLEKQLSKNVQMQNLSVDRYFDALEGPELDTLKVCVSYL